MGDDDEDRRKLSNRKKGIDKAVNRLTKEDVEALDEEESALTHDGSKFHYHIVDRHTKSVVGRAKNLRAAIRSVDKRDNAYGAYRYHHKRVEEPHPDVAKKQQVKEEFVSIVMEGFFDEIHDRLEQIEELSSDTLNSYKGKSFVDQHRGGDRTRPFSDADQRKYRKRGAGQQTARSKLNGTARVPANEEVIDEVSTKKALNYLDRSSEDVVSGVLSGRHSPRKITNRERGIATATKKIGSSARVPANEEHIDEISDVAKSSYLSAARQDRDKARKELTDSSSVNPHALKRMSKRVMGIDRAKGENNG